MTQQMFRSGSGWLILAGLVLTPWAMGGVPIWAERSAQVLLAAAVVVWLLGQVREPELRRLPWPLVGAVAWLLAQGWWMTLNAHARYLPAADAFLPVESVLPWAPGSVDRATSFELMVRLTCLAGVLLIAAALGRDPRWRRATWATIGITGASIAAFGLLQRVGVTDITIRQMTDRGLPFATFNYHANAGAFLNLALPAAFTWVVVAQRRSAWVAAGWSVALGLIVVAAFATLSRGTGLVTLLLLAILGVWRLRRILLRPAVVAAVLGVTAAGMSASAAASARGEGWLERWQAFPAELSRDSGRIRLARLALQLAGEAPVFGHGPGSFKLLMPGMLDPKTSMRKHWVKVHSPGEPVHISSHAHQDYAQTLGEWGIAGTAAVAVLGVGGVVRLVRHARQEQPGRPARIETVWIGASLLGVAVHALFDFPLQMLTIQLYVAVLLGLAWSAPAWRASTETDAATTPTE